MPRLVSFILAGLLLTAGTPASAGADVCSDDVADVSRFYCHLERVDTVRLQFQGTAAELGAKRPDLEQIMRERLDRFLAALPKPARGALPLIEKRPQQGQLLCTLWTVGQDSAIALFVECALRSGETLDSVEARLLGRTTAEEFDMASRIALGQVVSHVTTRYLDQRGIRLARPSKASDRPVRKADATR